MTGMNLYLTTAQSILAPYLDYLEKRPDGSEAEYRTRFENMMNALAPGFGNLTIVQEDRQGGVDVDGMPDFFIYRDHQTLFSQLVGFVECKRPSRSLESLIAGDQIKKYRKSCDNIILTNYREFLLLQRGGVVSGAALANNAKSVMDFMNLLRDFYQYSHPWIKTKKMLSSALAAQSFYYSTALRDYIANPQKAHESFHIKFKALFDQYQQSLGYHYELADFCDIYSQSLVYGLLLARLDSQAWLDEKLLNYLDGIPSEYALLHEFLESGYGNRNLPVEIKVALVNIGKNINHVDEEAVLREFAKANNNRQNIAVYLYEDFLSQYDKLRKTENRRENGVYYTPPEAADFIARGVGHILEKSFNLPGGYNADGVRVLDFACGTGTFLHSVYDQMLPPGMDGLAKLKMREKIANDIYGFELLFTPYIIAHTMLGRFLRQRGVPMEDFRPGIYLTNTLDISQHSISALLPRLKREYEKAQDIKDREQILAIIGNPPYFNGKSRAEKGVIDGLLHDYKAGLNEKKINLDDIYVKFIRFAEWKIAKCGHGVVGIITNNSWLDGVTHRAMRRHLFETFDEIDIVNLHGNSRKGDADKNIFDIMVGVCIVFLLKHKEPARKKRVRYFSTLDNGLVSRAEKLNWLDRTRFKDVDWVEIKPAKTEYHWFVPHDASWEGDYKKFWSIKDIFNKKNSGIQTKKDHFVLQYDREKLRQIIHDFQYAPLEKIKEAHGLADGVWTAEKARDSLRAAAFDERYIRQIHYRPFDYRWTYLHKTAGFLARPRHDVAKFFNTSTPHGQRNLGLCFTRQLFGEKWQHIWVADKMIECCAVSAKSREWTFIAPLYLLDEDDAITNGHSHDNWTDIFRSRWLATLSFAPSPEEVLAYIYAVLHSPTYRATYARHLKKDFPRVPMTRDETVFRNYAALGGKLINFHLLRDVRDDPVVKVSIENVAENFVIHDVFPPDFNSHELVLLTTAGGRVTFENVAPEVYTFRVGSYMPVQQWLKYRVKNGVALSPAVDLLHIKNMVAAIHNTLAIMRKLDAMGCEYLA